MLTPLFRMLFATTCFAVAVLVSTPAQAAGGMLPFESAAREYRSAVQAFERLVHRVRYLDRFDVMLVERLENASCDFYGTSFRPNDVTRVSYYWNEVESLQPRVANALFGRDCYPINVELAECWERVMCAHEDLSLRLNPPVYMDRNGRVLGRATQVPTHSHDMHAPPISHAPPILQTQPIAGSYNDQGVPVGYQATFAVPAVGGQAYSNGHDFRRDPNVGFEGSDRRAFGEHSNRRVDGRDLGSIIVSSLLQRALAR